MCHGEKSPAFPDPGAASPYSKDIQAMVFGSPDAARQIAILPDIFGCNPFYQGFATYLAARGFISSTLSPAWAISLKRPGRPLSSVGTRLGTATL